MARTITVNVEQVGPTTGKASARSHSLLIDRPVEKGGEDRGPLGGELMLLSLGGCFLSTLLAAIKTRTADISDVRVAVNGSIGGVPERFEAIDMRVTATHTDADLLRKLVGMAERGCLVTNTLRDAVIITIDVG